MKAGTDEPRHQMQGTRSSLHHWGSTPKPSDTVQSTAELTALRIELPQSEAVRALHDALGSTIPVVHSEQPRLAVQIAGPDGTFGAVTS